MYLNSKQINPDFIYKKRVFGDLLSFLRNLKLSKIKDLFFVLYFTSFFWASLLQSR